MDIYTIENKYGSLIIDSGQKPILGYQPFAEYFRQLSGCIYVTEEKLFYCYNPINGLWEKQGQMDMINRISKEILQFARDNDIEDEFAGMRRPAVIKEILVYLSSLAQAPVDFFNKGGRWIHCLNGVIEIDNAGLWQLKPFSPDYHSRNRCNLVYDPQADCPRFKEQLLAPLLGAEDIDLLQKYFGQCLLGRNLTQTIMLLTGSGGSGKGTIANILEMVVGAANCMQIRPGCIGGRFETNSFIGKTLLTGKESQTSFFTTKGMGIMKSLVGDDALRVELKHSNETQMIQGTYNVFIVGNAVPVLEFESDDDISAWQRRLRWIKCKSYKPVDPVDNFAKVLFEEEGSGILNWCYWCILADKNIFSTKQWARFAPKMVCLKVDFPKEGRPDAETMAKRWKLAKEFNVRGYPTFVLVSPERKEIARFSAGRKSADEFIDEIKKVLKP